MGGSVHPLEGTSTGRTSLKFAKENVATFFYYLVAILCNENDLGGQRGA